MITSITGHRPEKIPDMHRVVRYLHDAYHHLGVTKVIQGMAAGVDLESAKTAYLDEIPFWAVRPWAGHTPRRGDEGMYQQALKYAERVVDVNPSLTYPGPYVYHDRNHWMVDHAQQTIAVWDGKPDGGTYQCVKYALEKGVRVYRIDPVTFEEGWLN